MPDLTEIFRKVTEATKQIEKIYALADEIDEMSEDDDVDGQDNGMARFPISEVKTSWTGGG